MHDYLPKTPPQAKMQSKKMGESKKKPDRFWLWVVAAFLILIAAWTSFIIIAAKNPNPQIELEQ